MANQEPQTTPEWEGSAQEFLAVILKALAVQIPNDWNTETRLLYLIEQRDAYQFKKGAQ